MWDSMGIFSTDPLPSFLLRFFVLFGKVFRKRLWNREYHLPPALQEKFLKTPLFFWRAFHFHLVVISMNGELALSGDSVTTEIKFASLPILLLYYLNLTNKSSKHILGKLNL